MANLVIKNVDLEMLERQRLELALIPRTLGTVGLLPTKAVEALDGIQNMLDGWSDQRVKDLWKVDALQFPRLICEILAAYPDDDENILALCASMDIAVGDLHELFERAHTAWEKAKEEYCG